MSHTVFDAFPEAMTDYTFLQISRGGVTGDAIISETEAQGIFKERRGMVSNSDQETRRSDTTLKIRPDESYLTALGGNVVGHGIRIGGKDYEVTGQTAGHNYDDGTVEHLRLTLGAADFSDYEVVG